MKRFLSIMFAVAVVLQLAACGGFGGNDTAKVDTIGNTSQSETDPNSDTNSHNDSSSDISVFDGVSSYEDLLDRIDDNYDIEETEDEDGGINVEIMIPDPDDDDDNGPAIPDIDTVRPDPKPQPQPEQEPEPNPQPEPELEPEPEPEPEPKPEPEPEPQPQPQPQPQPKPETKPTYTTGQKHTEVALEDYYLYGLLNDTQKGWYLAIHQAVENLEGSVKLDGKISENRNYYIFFIYTFDHPEHFYLGNTLSLYTHGDGTSEIKICYSDGETSCKGELTPKLRQSIPNQKAKFEAEVDRIISTIPADAPDVWKERLIYERILLDSHYNLGAEWNGVCEPNWNAYGIINNKYGVCESYSEAFQLLCLRVGINATSVVGNAGGGHKWSAVQLDGEWYICDITFDDPIGGGENDAYFYYFNRTTAEMEAMHHSTEGSDYPGPKATATKYSFENSFGDESRHKFG